MTDDVKARHPDIPQDPLFDVEQPGLFDEPPRVAKPRRKSVKRAGVGTCPTCGQEETGQVRDTTGGLVWRIHYRRTIAARPILCRLSGQSVGE